MSKPLKKVAILQSNYIPWKGYFDLINSVDDFILYDEVQYTRRDWRNRNIVKTSQGLRWLTIPVEQFSFTQNINETYTADNKWAIKHWRTILQSYAKAPFLEYYQNELEELFNSHSNRLSEINQRFIETINNWLGIKTRLHSSADFKERTTNDRTGRLIELVLAVGGTEYISGPAAKAYIDTTQFAQAGITLTWMRYEGYPEYRQQHGLFEHKVSILDLLLNEGPNSPDYMLSFADRIVL